VFLVAEFELCALPDPTSTADLSRVAFTTAQGALLTASHRCNVSADPCELSLAVADAFKCHAALASQFSMEADADWHGSWGSCESMLP
jgi:hypothetical protein